MDDFVDIIGYEGLYKINKEGIVINKHKKILKPSCCKSNGYLHIRLHNNKIQKSHLLHRLLGIHFIPNPYNYTEIDHIDKNKINNSLDNLRWIDKSGNCRNTKNNRKYDLPRGVSKTPNNKYQVNIRIKG